MIRGVMSVRMQDVMWHYEGYAHDRYGYDIRHDRKDKAMLSRPSISGFSPGEWFALERLRRRYQQDADVLTERELVQLRFIQWLVQTGRLAFDDCPDDVPAGKGDVRWIT